MNFKKGLFGCFIVGMMLSTSSRAHLIRRSGLHIELQTKEKTAYKAGEKATIEGEYCRVSVHQQNWKNLCLGLPDKHVEARFFYPDLTTQVEVSTTKKHKTVYFSFETPELSADQGQAFYVVLGKPDHKIDHLMRIEAKLARRIEFLENLLSHFHKRHKKEESRKIELLTDLRNTLESVRVRILERLSREPSIIAQRSLPLQVDNQYVFEPTRYATLLGDFEFALNFVPGSTIEGQVAHVQAKITNEDEISSPFLLDDGEEGDDGDDGKDPKDQRAWTAKLYFNGDLIHEFEPKKLASGESFFHEFDTPKLLPTEKNEIKLELFKKTGFFGHWKKYTHRYGKLTLEIPTAEDKVAPQFLSPNSFENHPAYVQNPKPVSVTVLDSFGFIDPASIHAVLSGATNGGENINLDVTNLLLLNKNLQGQSYDISGIIQNTPEGVYTLSLRTQDLSENFAEPDPISANFRVDRTSPELFVQFMGDFLTNIPNHQIPISVVDYSPTETEVFVNGNLVYTSSEFTFAAPVSFQEGINSIEVRSVDYAQNGPTVVQFNNITLDTTPPLIVVNPNDGATLTSLSFPVSGTSNEPLSQLFVNGQSLALSEDKLTFSGNLSFLNEGFQNLKWEAIDLAGNKTTLDLSVLILLKVVRQELVSIMPSLDGSRLQVVGAKGSARPGAEIDVQASFINRDVTSANADGSFLVELRPFEEVTVTGRDINSGQTDSFSLTFDIDTTLGGTVVDHEGTPLEGVTMSIAGSPTVRPVVTNSDGMFQFLDPATGDQILIADGTTIPSEITGPNKKFSSRKVSISIGLSQSNVLPSSIKLTPLLLDGTETAVDENQSVFVTSPHAPGVELRADAGTTVFPDGTKQGSINVLQVPADAATTPPPSFAKPTTVYAFEPSGVEFSEPADLVLPNDNELSPGVEVAILSMNSQKGVWEIGATAVVSEDGSRIETKPNQGVLHFSEMFAVPVGLTVQHVGPKDRVQASTFDGQLSTQIQLPSYRSLGQRVSSTLFYKSGWANPSVTVTNIVDFTDAKIDFEKVITGEERQLVKNPFCEKTICFGSYDELWAHIEYEATVQGQVSFQPQFVEAQFFTENIQSQKMIFEGLLDRSAISYAFELLDPLSGQYLSSGIHPYRSHYDIHLKELTIGTQTVTGVTSLAGSVFNTDPEAFREERDRIFPQDLVGPLFIQNKTQSEAGRGWKIGGVQRILNPDSSRVLIEEENGEVSSYTLANNIETLYSPSEGQEIQAVDFKSWPDSKIALWNDGSKQGSLVSFDFESGSETSVSPGLLLSGTVARQNTSHGQACQVVCILQIFGACFLHGTVCTNQTSCNRSFHAYQFDWKPSDLFTLPSGKVIGSHKAGSLLFEQDGNTSSILAGQTQTPQTFEGAPNTQTVTDYCSSIGTECSVSSSESFVLGGHVSCPGVSSSGSVPAPDFQDGDFSTAQFNNPQSIAPAPGNALLIADYGNHRVRKIDLSTGQVTTIAGSSKLEDNGDGGLAIEAGIMHPRGVVSDSLGNVYISTQNGFIRKVSTDGIIQTVAGLSPNDPRAILSERAPASQVALNEPFGLALDEDNKFLYVADTGHRRVVRINLLTQVATSVAGAGGQDFNGDGISALQANLGNPTQLGLDANGNLLIFDSAQQRIRRVIFQATNIGTIAFNADAKDHSSLQRFNDGNWLRTYRDGRRAFYNELGYQTELTNLIGEKITFNYDVQNRLVSQIDPVGLETIYTYSGGKISSIRDPAGRSTQFVFTGDLLTEVIFPDSTKRLYTYNEKGMLIGETNQRGFKTQYAYNEFNQIQKVIRPDLSEVIINDVGSATAGNFTSMSDPGILAPLGQDGTDMKNQITDGNGNVTDFVTGPDGTILSVVDVDGNETRIKRRLDGRATEIVQFSGSGDTAVENSRKTMSYNECGDLVQQSDTATGITTSQTYRIDENCQGGQLLTQTDAMGSIFQREYDIETGLLLAEISPIGQRIERTYVPGFSIIKSTRNVDLGQQTIFDHDASGNVIGITRPGGVITTIVRDIAGNTISTKNNKNQKRDFEFDSFNRMIAATTAVGTSKEKRTEYVYTEDGKLEKITDPIGNTIELQYNSLSLLVSKKDQLGFVTLLQYDDNGNVIQTSDPNGNVTKLKYDTKNRLIEKILPDNLISFQYDKRDNLIQIKDVHAQLDFQYDLLNRITSETNSHTGATLEFEYDFNGNRIALIDPTGRTDYSHDEVNRLTQIANPFGEIYSFNFDQGNRLVGITRPGSKTVFSFDDSNLVAQITHSNGGVDIAKFIYTRDEIGYLKTRQSLKGLTSFDYDFENQVTLASSSEIDLPPDFQNESFDYDPIFNRVSDQRSNYSYDLKKQRLQEDAFFTYTYDSNGNLTKKIAKKDFPNGEVTNYSYSSENQLIKLERYNQNQLILEAHYLYDPIGRRIQKQVIDHTAPSDPRKSFFRKYVYDGQEILLEYDENSQLLARYTHSTIKTDDVLSVHVTQQGVSRGLAQEAKTYQYLKDSIGTITDVTDSNGGLIQHYVYSVFGMLLGIQDASAAEIAENPVLNTAYSFSGREYDSESKLFYYRARYYDPGTGRFLQKDPEPGRVQAPVTMINSFAYTANNPLNFIDPTGASITDAFRNIIYGIAHFFEGIANAIEGWVKIVIGIPAMIFFGDKSLLNEGLKRFLGGIFKSLGGLGEIFSGTIRLFSEDFGKAAFQSANSLYAGGDSLVESADYPSVSIGKGFASGYVSRQAYYLALRLRATQTCADTLESQIKDAIFFSDNSLLDPIRDDCPIPAELLALLK